MLQYLVQKLFGTRLAIFWMAEKFVFRTVFQNLAANVHKNHAASDLAGESHLMRDAHHGHAFVGEVDHHIQNFANHLGI